MSLAMREESKECQEYEGNKKWLNAHYDPLASLYTFSQCIALSDINADGENKLIIADLGTGTYDMKLKVYRGTTLMSENTIMDLPTGVVTFYMDLNEPRTPAIAVASGSFIYIYKNLKPYFKFTLPSLPIDEQEENAWTQAKDDLIDVSALREILDNLRSKGVMLTVRSMKFLRLPPHELSTFVTLHKNSPLKMQTVVTCLDTLKKSHSEDDSISCLVLGTEHMAIFILDPEAFTILTKIDIPAVPVFISVNGLYDVDYRIVVACRNGAVYSLKRGIDVLRPVFQLGAQPVGLQRIGKNIIIASMDQTLQCYSTKGTKLWLIRMPADILTMEVMEDKQKGFKGVIVGVDNREVHIYRDKYLVNIIKTESSVTGIKFGKFGREDSTLIMTTKGGSLLIKMLKRTAKFEERDATTSSGPPQSQQQKLNVPKKTKLFVDQTLRERNNCVIMHQQFQHDLYRLRLEAARNYVESLNKSLNPISTNPQEPLKLSICVNGIGPMFKLIVQLQNTSLSSPSAGLFLTFHYDNALYSVEKTLISVPFLVPGLNYTFESYIECKSDKGISDTIKAYLFRRNCSTPIITGIINMPVSESIIVS